MKKFTVLIGIILAIVASLIISVPALADGPTNVTVTWSGTTDVTGNVNTGDSVTGFSVSANNATGTFTATDSNNNPYSYGVDNNSAAITGNFSGGGEMVFQTTRTDSYAPMYGASGQTVYNYVGSSDAGSMTTNSGTNYAGMVNCTYGQDKTLSSGYNYTASGSSFVIQQYVTAPGGDYAGFVSGGNGSAVIDSMTTQASGLNNTDLGWGGGCYTNADATFTGAGTFQVSAVGANNISTPISGASGTISTGGWVLNGNGTSGSATMSVIANYLNGGSVGNFSVKVQ